MKLIEDWRPCDRQRGDGTNDRNQFCFEHKHQIVTIGGIELLSLNIIDDDDDDYDDDQDDCDYDDEDYDDDDDVKGFDVTLRWDGAKKG